MEHSSALQSLARIFVDHGAVGAARRAARAFSPELDLTTTERLVLAYVQLRCGSLKIQGGNLGEECWASLPDIATTTGRSLRAVRYSLRRLEAEGYVSSEVKQRGVILGGEVAAHRATLVVTAKRELPPGKVSGLHGSVYKAFDSAIVGQDGKSLSASRRAVLAVLLIHAGEDGWSWPSYGTIAAMTSLTERTVGDAVRELIAVGHVIRKFIPPTWGDQQWKIRYCAVPSPLHRAKPKAGAAQPGNGFLATRQPLPEKEIHEGDPSPEPTQLDLFVLAAPSEARPQARPGTRAAEVEAVVEATKDVRGVKVTEEHRERIQARLSEGIMADDLVVALRVASEGPGEKRDLMTTVTRSKAVVTAYLDLVGRGGRYRTLETGKNGIEEERAEREAHRKKCMEASEIVSNAFANRLPPPEWARKRA